MFEKEGYYFLTKKFKKLVTEPLTLCQATELCKAYQHLVGHVVLGEKNEFEVIDCVAVAPHSKLNKLLFFKLYKDSKSVDDSIAFYDASEYDVIIILRQLVADGDYYLKYVELDAYLKKNEASINILSLSDNK